MNLQKHENTATTTHQEQVGNGHISECVYTPAIDIHETQDGLVIDADLPGVTTENLDVKIEDKVLSIYGKVKWPLPKDAELLHEEYRYGDFYRSFILNDDVDTEKLTADFQDGVLRLNLPKAEKAKPRKIEIRTSK